MSPALLHVPNDFVNNVDGRCGGEDSGSESNTASACTSFEHACVHVRDGDDRFALAGVCATGEIFVFVGVCRCVL